MSKIEELNEKIQIIFDLFDNLTNNPSNEFVDDYTVYTSILYDKYEKVDKNFWNYFKNKYRLPDIENNFESHYDLLRTVFDKCIHPFYLRLDILPDYHSKYKNVADNFEKVWKFNRFFSNNWITILSFILMFVFLALAVDSKNNNYDFDYDVYISLSTGFLISLIISGINASHKRRLRNKKAEFNQILYQFELLKKSYNKINEYMMKEDIKNNKDFVSEFCEFNNSLNDFLDNTSKILSLQSSSIYQWFKDFEKEIFDYSSSIVQKDFDKTIMDQTTDEEIAVLQKYVIQFRYWVNHFEFDIMNLKHYYGKDIDKMKDKSL